ncbi:signal transducing kinase of the PAK, partial [Neodidymelliopsis sp. IMI 364377]
MDERDSKAARRLTSSKKTRERAPPPVSYNNKYSTASSLKRAPSAASYFERAGSSYTSGLGIGLSHPTSHAHAHADPASSSSSSSLRRSPSLLTPLHESRTVNASGAYGFHDHHPARLPSGHDLVGDSFTHIVAGAHGNSSTTTTATSTTTKQPRPPGPVHAQTADHPSRFRPPRLRQSTSFQQLARKMDTPPSGTKSPRNRYSDEADGPKTTRRSDAAKKKGTFSTFMSSMLGSPRRPTISTPTNPMHVTHVSIDNETGEFTGLPKEWQRMLQQNGITEQEQKQHPQAAMDVVNFYKTNAEKNSDDDVWEKMGAAHPHHQSLNAGAGAYASAQPLSPP